MKNNAIILSVILIFVSCISVSAANKNDTKVRIHLTRQKSFLERYLLTPNPESYGISYEWLHKHHKKNNRTNDSIALYRFLDHEFYGQVVIGHPGQTLNVAFDTAWSLSWVLSSKCNAITKIGCLFHRKYDDTKSSEYKPDGRPFSFFDGSFNYTGFYGYEHFSIAHSNATNQSFIEMTSVPSTFIFNKADGVLGLGLQINNGYKPFFYHLLDTGKIKNPIFSIYLNRDTQSNRGGNIMLGFIDDKHIHKNNNVPEKIKYLSVDPGEWWQFQVDKIYFDNQKKPLVFCKNGCKAISDTSTNTIIGPADDVNAIHEAINARELVFGRYSVHCDTINKLPKISFLLGGQNFTISGPNYISKITYESFTVCISAFIGTEPPDENDLWVLGAAFLAEYYSIYDVLRNQIGFVKASSKI